MHRGGLAEPLGRDLGKRLPGRNWARLGAIDAADTPLPVCPCLFATL